MVTDWSRRFAVGCLMRPLERRYLILSCHSFIELLTSRSLRFSRNGDRIGAKVGVDMPPYLIRREPIPNLTDPIQCQATWHDGCYRIAPWQSQRSRPSSANDGKSQSVVNMLGEDAGGPSPTRYGRKSSASHRLCSSLRHSEYLAHSL